MVTHSLVDAVINPSGPVSHHFVLLQDRSQFHGNLQQLLIAAWWSYEAEAHCGTIHTGDGDADLQTGKRTAGLLGTDNSRLFRGLNAAGRCAQASPGNMPVMIGNWTCGAMEGSLYAANNMKAHTAPPVTVQLHTTCAAHTYQRNSSLSF